MLQFRVAETASGVTATAGEMTERGIRITQGPAHDVDCDMGHGCRCGAIERSYIRRPTLREFERWQGIPDDHTRIPWDGKPAAECPPGLRYKAIGNAWALPVARWVGERIAMVERITGGAA